MRGNRRRAHIALFASALCLLLAGLQPALAAVETNSEAQCIQVLKSSASPMEKDAACVRLKHIGTARSVPALADLLTDPQLSDSARYVLEAMSAPAAERSLIAALRKTSGSLKVGIIDSLGVRREKAAVSALIKALKDPDPDVASAAAAALGEIANKKALTALQAASTGPAGSVHDAVVDAMLGCANRLLAAGDRAKALALFQKLYATQREPSVQVAAYRGLLLASGKQTLALTIEAIAGPEGAAQTAALQLVHDLDAPGATAAFAQLLPRAPARVQVSLVENLAQRNDPAAAPAVTALANSPAPTVRLAVVRALGNLGDATVVPLLAEAAASAAPAERALRDAARDSLAQLNRGEPDRELIRLLPTAQPAVQLEMGRALGARGDHPAVPKLLALAGQGADSTRQAALLALGQLVDQAEVGSLARILLEAPTDTARAQAAEALNTACRHVQFLHGHFEVEPLITALASANAEARIALLPVCAAFNDPQVRVALRAGVADSNPQVHTAAVRALCDTTDAELLPDLVKLGCGAPENNLRTLAIGACVRLMTQEETVKLPNAQRAETFKTLLAAAPNVEQKRLLLAGLAEIPNAEALELAEGLLADTAVQNEAAHALIKIVAAMPGSSETVAALKRLLAVVQDADTRQAAEAVLNQSDAGAGYITSWQVAGPYRQEGKNYSALFDMPFPPELPGSQRVRWRTLAPGTDPKRPWVMDLRKALGGLECVAYSRTRVHCDHAQAARLEIGSDDGVKIWLDGKLVHARNVARALRPGSDKVNVTLPPGWNDLLLKVTQHNQGWAFCARFVALDGLPVGGLQFDPGPQSAPVGKLTSGVPAPAALGPKDPTFKKVQITDKFWAEGASYADFNRDGQMDIVSGPFWYEGPDFKKRHEIWPATASFKRKRPDGTEENFPGFEGALGVKNAYSECFLTFTWDFNNDGWPDVLVIGFPGKAAYWYENPKGAPGPWPRHEVFDEVGDESPDFADVTGDGKPEILCCARGCMGYLEADWKNPAALWTFHPITPNTPKGAYQKFTHGIGCGDINGDGRTDIIEKDGWWEQPASRQGDPLWTKHPFHFADEGAQMLVYDVNGDGLNDVITSLNAHGYGLAWYEQARTNGAITFRQHLILNPDGAPDRYGVSFTQPHSLALADINGDGLMDIVTGKRFWAHGKNGGDPESDGYPAVLYWFQLKRGADGQAEYIPHLIDDDSGVGTQVTAGFISNQALPDIVVGNKKGLFVFERETRKTATPQ